MFLIPEYYVYRLLEPLSPDLDQAELNKMGVTSLMLAVHRKSTHLVKKLSRDLKLLNRRDSRGYTALAHAVALNDVRCVEILMKAGANIKGAVQSTDSKAIVRSLYAIAIMHRAQEVLDEYAASFAQCLRRCQSLSLDAYYVALCAGSPAECSWLESDMQIEMPSASELHNKGPDERAVDMAFLLAVFKADAPNDCVENIKAARLWLIQDESFDGERHRWVQFADHLALLHAAHATEDPNILDYLLEHVEEIDYGGTLDKTSLHWAVRWAKHDYVKRLLDAGADPLHRARDGDTPLSCAVRRHQGAEALELVLMMLAAIAQKDGRDDREKVASLFSNAFSVAVKHENDRCADVLFGYAHAHEIALTIGEDVGPVNAMRVAVCNGNVTVFKSFFDAHSPEKLMCNGTDLRRVFHDAVCAHDAAVLTFMVQWYDARLHNAAISQDGQSVVRSVLQSVGAGGNTWLHHAASYGSLGGMSALLAMRLEGHSMFPNVTQKNHAGWTPIMLAAWCGHLAVVKYLLGLQRHRGLKPPGGDLDLTIKTSKGNTALHLAIGAAAKVVHGVALPSLESCDAMFDHASAQSTEIAKNNYRKVVSQLCAHAKKLSCDSLTIADAQGRTPFLMLVCGGFLRQVKWFVRTHCEVGSDMLGASDNHGRDALALAQMHGHDEIVNYLKRQPLWADRVALSANDDTATEDTPAMVLNVLAPSSNDAPTSEAILRPALCAEKTASEEDVSLCASPVPAPVSEDKAVPESPPSSWRRFFNYCRKLFSSNTRDDASKPVSKKDLDTIGSGCANHQSAVPIQSHALIGADKSAFSLGFPRFEEHQPRSLKLCRSTSESSLLSMSFQTIEESSALSFGSRTYEDHEQQNSPLMRCTSAPGFHPRMDQQQDRSFSPDNGSLTFN